MVWRRKRARRWRSMRKSSGSFLGAVREVRALILEGADAAPLVRDMQERIAVQFAAWAGAMAGSGGHGSASGRARLGAGRGAGAHRRGLGRALGRESGWTLRKLPA